MAQRMIDADPFEQLLRDALAPTYLLVRKLGAGGMGSVYLARDPALKRLVAVKVLSPELADELGPRSRFQREAEAVASLSHPNVVAVYNVGKLANGVPYFVMQHVSGRSFADRLEAEGPLDADSARRFLGDVASALAAAHKQGIIHRDIKPANILHDDESDRALVTDFGIASVLSAGADAPSISPTQSDIAAAVMTRLTQTGVMVGTPAYMSPEQLLAEPVTEKTDVYSLGLLGYELLTGQGPYTISSPGEIIAAHILADPKPLSSVRADVDPEVESLIHACLAKDAAARPAAEEVSKRLSRGAHVMLEWPPPATEQLHGKLRGAVVPIGIGALLIGIPLAMMAALDVDSTWRRNLPPTAALVSILALGVGLLAVGALRMLRLTRGAAEAMRSGLGWRTVAEVAVDHRHDGGVLIVGGREYATLSPAQRGVLRKRRMTAGALALAASISPMLGAVGALLIGRVSPFGPTALLVGAIAVPLVLWTVTLNVEAREAVSLSGARKRLARAAPRQSAAELLAAWRGTFDEARRGQPDGGEFRVSPAWLRAAGGVLMTATFMTALGVLGAWTAALSSAKTYDALLVDRGRLFWIYELKRHVLTHRTPVDTTVSPLRAGEAWHALAVYSTPLYRQPARQFEWSPARMGDKDLAKAEQLFGGGIGGANWLALSLRVAKNGFSDRQRELLVKAASTSGPAAREFAVLARAQRTDFWAAALKLPLLGGTDLVQPDWPVVPRVAAVYRGRLAAAALALEAGRTAEAEASIREMIGVGLAMMEDRWSGVAWDGYRLVRDGADALREFYLATGRSDALRSLERFTRDVSFAEDRFADAEEATWKVREAVLDSTSAPSVRWSGILFVIPYLPCLELRQLVFPPDRASRTFWTDARARLVRDSTDAMLFHFAEGALDHPISLRPNASLTERTQRFGLRVLDAVVGGHRFEACGARRGNYGSP